MNLTGRHRLLVFLVCLCVFPFAAVTRAQDASNGLRPSTTPNSTESALEAANLLYRRGNPAAAVEAFKAIATSDPQSALAYVVLARAYLALKNPTDAADATRVKGINGSVRDVFRADDLTLTFGHMKQRNIDIVAFDTKSISDSIGVEVSGTLGFAMLRLLDIKIDYRDGLVDFTYDRNRIIR